MTRALSLAALTVLDLAPPEQVRCAAGAGYSHVGLRPVPATDSEPTWALVGDTPLRRDVLAALRDSGIGVLDIEILRLKPETDVAAFEPVLETGAVLGARFVLVAGNDPDEARTVERLGCLAELASRYGLMPCLEPMPWTDVGDFAQALRIVEATGRGDVGVLVDPLHFDRGGSDAVEIGSAAPGRLPYMQLCDAPAERPSDLQGLLLQARAERLPPGEGGLDLRRLLAAMPAGQPLSLEVPMVSRGLAPLARARLVRDTTCRWLAGGESGAAA